MNLQQIMQQMLNFVLQEHVAKDKLIEDLQRENTDLKKRLAGPATPAPVK